MRGDRIPSVVEAVPMDDYRVRVVFDDGAHGVWRFAEAKSLPGPMGEPLRDPDFFARVFIDGGALTWPSEYDVCPHTLYVTMALSGALASADDAA